MSIAARLVEKLESWLVHAVDSRSTGPSQDGTALLQDSRSRAADADPPRYARDEKERELELQMLMSSWM
jgi:hypothetical protein